MAGEDEEFVEAVCRLDGSSVRIRAPLPTPGSLGAQARINLIECERCGRLPYRDLGLISPCQLLIPATKIYCSDECRDAMNNLRKKFAKQQLQY